MLGVLAEVIRQDPQACFGFIAAAMLNEASDANTKRYRLYIKMLELKIDSARHQVVSKVGNSSIFVLPVEIAAQPALLDEVVARYERIFAETF